jgi:hypothetical protein
MKGVIRKAAAALCCAAGAAGGGGCCCSYHDLVDPCYPQRYEWMAREEVNEAFAPQVQNGHVLDQTVWNYHFEPGCAKLTPGGLEHLAYLARRRPCPDTTVYLQSAQDLPYDGCAPDRLVVSRQELDAQRIQAIQAFLQAQTAGRGGCEFQVVVHDPAEVGLTAIPVNLTVQQMYQRYRGGLLGGGGGGSPAGGGGAVGR